MDPDYRLDGMDTTEPTDLWDDPAIGRYLAQTREADRDRIDAALAQIDEQLQARKRLHEEFIAELQWQVTKYERELDRLSKPGLGTDDAREQLYAGLREVRQAIRDERREHWRDRQRLERERRELLQDRAAVTDAEDLLEFL